MKNTVCKISLLSLILACATTVPAWSAVKTKNSNRSYASGYQQVNAMRYQQEYLDQYAANATTASASENLPVAVDDENLANAILNNTSTTNVSELEACSMIFPNGVFKWGVPTSNTQSNPEPGCIAVVELRDVNTKAVLATTTVAVGDIVKCNVDSFPVSGMSYDLKHGKIEVPADTAPTEEDVIEVMNQEQRQNAGLKIAAGALIAGVAGNLLAPKDASAKTGKIPLGTGKTQLIDTAIGAAAGAGIMAASSYTGKVAGDTIKSTAVNAASGMLVGNMLAGASGGSGVLATTKCTIKEGENQGEHDCIVGNVVKVDGTISTDQKKGENCTEIFYIMTENAGDIRRCCKKSKKDTEYTCTKDPDVTSLARIMIKKEDGSLSYETYKDKGQNTAGDGVEIYTKKATSDNNNDKENTFEKSSIGESAKKDATRYLRIDSAYKAGHKEHAYAVFTNKLDKKIFGYDMSKWKADLEKQATFYKRNYDGSVGSKIEIKDGNYDFIPSSRDAEDGGLIDLSNESRVKGTLVGTAAGGALGGLAGYQGAKSELTERFLAAQREYEGSLTNFGCWTGGRYLAPYNSYIDIPLPDSLKK